MKSLKRTELKGVVSLSFDPHDIFDDKLLIQYVTKLPSGVDSVEISGILFVMTHQIEALPQKSVSVLNQYEQSDGIEVLDGDQSHFFGGYGERLDFDGYCLRSMSLIGMLTREKSQIIFRPYDSRNEWFGFDTKIDLIEYYNPMTGFVAGQSGSNLIFGTHDHLTTLPILDVRKYVCIDDSVWILRDSKMISIHRDQAEVVELDAKHINMIYPLDSEVMIGTSKNYVGLYKSKTGERIAKLKGKLVARNQAHLMILVLENENPHHYAIHKTNGAHVVDFGYTPFQNVTISCIASRIVIVSFTVLDSGIFVLETFGFD